MREKIDLHCHTNISDGALSPEQIVSRAIGYGLSHLAITDHDTVGAYDRACVQAQGSDLTVIPGIEISTTFNSVQIHIVGLFLDIKNEKLLDLIKRQRVQREERAALIGHKLEKLGFKDALLKTQAMAGDNAVITRGNYARYLFSTGLFATQDEAFNKYLKKGGRAYVNTQWISVEEACSIIAHSGGVAVLAHPKRYTMTNSKLRLLIEHFKEAGGMALEVSSSQQSPADRDYLASLCERYEMYGSVGSDFHSEGPWRDLGLNLKLPEKVKPVWTLPQAQAFGF